VSRLIEDSRISNLEHWNIIGRNRDWSTSTEVYDAKTYDAQITLLKGWFNKRIPWMNDEISKF
jgi:hypothetical protein